MHPTSTRYIKRRKCKLWGFEPDSDGNLSL